MKVKPYHRPIKSAGIHKSRPFKCPICSKRQLFALLVGEDKGRIKKCNNCGYTNKKSMMDQTNSY